MSPPLQRLSRLTQLTGPVWFCLLLYTGASLAHFAHNAEYLVFYPNMPEGLTPKTIYLVWLAVAALGVGGVLLRACGWWRLGATVIVGYGLLGLDGLLHYTLALCREHTWGANLSIGAEVLAGLVLAGLMLQTEWRRHRYGRSAMSQR